MSASYPEIELAYLNNGPSSVIRMVFTHFPTHVHPHFSLSSRRSLRVRGTSFCPIMMHPAQGCLAKLKTTLNPLLISSAKLANDLVPTTVWYFQRLTLYRHRPPSYHGNCPHKRCHVRSAVFQSPLFIQQWLLGKIQNKVRHLSQKKWYLKSLDWSFTRSKECARKVFPRWK